MNWNWRDLVGDHQGSIIAAADSAGALVAANAYDRWGIPAAANLGRFQYSGQAFLPQHSLTAMARDLNNRAASIYGGSNEIQRNHIASLVLGL